MSETAAVYSVPGANSKPVAKRRGRPPMLFDQDVADEICRRAAESEPLTKICEDDAMPGWNTVYKWLNAFPSFAQAYARAREDSAESGYAEIMEIECDLREGRIEANTARVLVDSIKWRLGKLKPKVYGDVQRIDMTVSPGDMPDSELDRELVEAATAAGFVQALPKPEV